MLDPEIKHYIELREQYLAKKEGRVYPVIHNCGIKIYANSPEARPEVCECQKEPPKGQKLVICELGHPFFIPETDTFMHLNSNQIYCDTCLKIHNTPLDYELEAQQKARQNLKEDNVRVPGFEHLNPDQIERKVQNLELAGELAKAMKPMMDNLLKSFKEELRRRIPQ